MMLLKRSFPRFLKDLSQYVQSILMAESASDYCARDLRSGRRPFQIG